MKLTWETLPNYFTLADRSNSWHETPTNLYDFISVDSDTLLVTIGDSWTWGAWLSEHNQNDQIRKEHVFGRLMAKQLTADWLNLGLSASGNFWLAQKVEELAKIIPSLEYKKIIVVCTFTGVGRWFNTGQDQYIDYVDLFARVAPDFDQLLIKLNEECVKRILIALAPFDHVQLKVGTNFVEYLGFDALSTEQLLPKPWYQVLGLDDGEKIYTCAYFERISTGIEFLDTAYHDKYKQWVVDIVDQSFRRVRLLEQAPGFNLCHPAASDHRQWANYVLENL